MLPLHIDSRRLYVIDVAPYNKTTTNMQILSCLPLAFLCSPNRSANKRKFDYSRVPGKKVNVDIQIQNARNFAHIISETLPRIHSAPSVIICDRNQDGANGLHSKLRIANRQSARKT